MSQLHLLVFLVLVLLSNQQSAGKLIYVHEVFRHGARYPIYPNSIDFSNISIIDQASGELTRQGKSMQYLLGKQLYSTYWAQLFGSSNQYLQQKFYFKSTDVNRTIESLQSQLLGIFENTQILTINPNETNYSYPIWNTVLNRSAGDLYQVSPKFHSLPIHVQKGPSTPWTPGDYLRTYAPEFCYKQNDWQQANKRDPYIISITQNPNFTRAVAALSQAIGKDISFYEVYKYYDNYECLTYMSMNTLDIFKGDGEVAQGLAKIYDINTLMTLFYNDDQLRTTATGFFNETVNQFKRVTSNQNGVQWSFYSAHDTTLLDFLVKLDLTNVRCIYDNYLNGTLTSEYCILNYPSYTSSLIFEVYQYPDQTNTFKILYNGSPRRIPFCDYQLECDVQIFYSWYEGWKDEDWVRNCGIRNSEAETYFSIIIIELGVIIVFGVATLLRYLNSKKDPVNDPKKTEAKLEEVRQAQPQVQSQVQPQLEELLIQEDKEKA